MTIAVNRGNDYVIKANKLEFKLIRDMVRATVKEKPPWWMDAAYMVDDPDDMDGETDFALFLVTQAKEISARMQAANSEPV